MTVGRPVAEPGENSERAAEWVIVVTPLPSDVPIAARVKQLLKFAGRRLRLKCVAVRNPTAEELAAAARETACVR